jgi:hypothetical protein
MALLDIDQVVNRIDESAVVARPMDIKKFEKAIKKASQKKADGRHITVKTKKKRALSRAKRKRV